MQHFIADKSSAEIRTLDVICVGNIVADAVGINAEAIPEEGSLALFDRVEMHLGGCASNTAVALAKLGISVGLAAKVGTDGFGDFCQSELGKHGVDTRGLKRSESEATSFSFIMIPASGNRRIFHTPGANATFSADDIDVALFTGVQWVIFGGLALMPLLTGESLAAVLKAIKRTGTRIAADTVTNHRFTARDWEELLGPCYPYFDVFFPSEEEARAITGQSDPEKICTAFRNRGSAIAGVKLGDRGSAIMSDEVFFTIPAYPVKCVDTLGAGDCFMAGFIVGLLHGYTPLHAARLGNAVGAHCIQAIGATTGIPRLEQVLAFQQKNRNKP